MDMQQTTVGAEFARAVAARDAGRLRELLGARVDFRGMTPKRVWEAESADETVAIFFEHWFEPEDEIESVEMLETDAFADRERVGYRFRVRTEKGPYLVEQQAYLSPADDGRIAWMRVVCSGYRRDF
jgi:hypothetical protein